MVVMAMCAGRRGVGVSLPVAPDLLLRIRACTLVGIICAAQGFCWLFTTDEGYANEN